MIQAHPQNMEKILSKPKTPVSKDDTEQNDVKAGMTRDDVTYATEDSISPNFLRIPLKPIGAAEKQRPNDELINEKR